MTASRAHSAGADRPELAEHADASDENVAREVARTLSQLTTSSRSSLIMVALGVITLGASVYYSFTRLQPLENEIARKQAEVARLNREAADTQHAIEDARQQHAALKRNIEELYAVRVTNSNTVYEVKSTAKATGRNTSFGPEYKFSVLINAPADVLRAMRRVEYTFNHPTFKDKTVVVETVTDQFAHSYVGWGCLTRVDVDVVLNDGSRHPFNFNMCRSLGPDWGEEANGDITRKDDVGKSDMHEIQKIQKIQKQGPRL